MAVASKKRATKPAKSTGPEVFPYGRFSYKGQAKGGSKRRQQGDDDEETRAKRYADKVGLPLNTTLQMFDAGISARHGENVSRGALGKFLAAIESGLIPTGSILWVESIDRLTRQNPLKGLKVILFDIIAKGIGIYVDDLHTLYDADNADDTIGELYGEIRRAYRESQRKSELIRATCEQKRLDAIKNGTLISQNVPAWIEVDASGKRKLRKGAAKALTTLLQMREKNDGNGAQRIAKYMNGSKLWSPPNGWTDVYIKKLWRDRRLIGEHQPGTTEGGKHGTTKANGDVIINYYPAAVDTKLFASVQQILKANPGRGGSSKKCLNVLKLLCVCPYCGGPMHHKPQTKRGNRREYLVCRNGMYRKSKCGHHGMRYDLALDAFLSFCRRIRVDQIIPQKSEQTKLVAALRLEAQRASATLADLDQRLANANDQAESAANPKRRKHWEQRAIELEADKEQAEQTARDAQQKLTAAQHAQTSFTDWQQEIAKLEKLQETPEGRRRLNAHLRTFIAKIEVFWRGYFGPDDDYTQAEDDDFEGFLAGVEDDGNFRIKAKQRPAFLAWLNAKRQTNAAQFVRIYYRHRAGKFFDVPIEGSIAGYPNVFQMFREFTNAK